MKPFRVIVRVKNNRLVRLREELGLTVAELARATGVDCSVLSGLETMRIRPLDGSGEWRASAIKIAEYHGVSPEYLWPDEVRAIRARAFQLEASAQELIALPADAEMDRKELVQTLHSALDKIPARDAYALVATVGTEDRFADVGKELGVSHTRASQLASRGLRTVRQTIDVRRMNGELDERIVKGFK